MRVGYRRAAGKIGLTGQETGVRGAWVEKRRAILTDLATRGHDVVLLSKLTDATAASGATAQEFAQVDVLFVEFAGINLSFFGKEWERTCEIVQAHVGPVVFLCDDPDLPFLWKLLPDEDWSRWTIAANATNPDAVRTVLSVPDAAAVIDWPMATGMPIRDFAAGPVGFAVYIGRPNGRTNAFRPFVGAPICVAGKEGEWAGWDFRQVPIPSQARRGDFYRRYKACLAVFDKKHAATGWRTGRAYHALHAGVPVIAPPGNPGLAWCAPVETAADVEAFVRSSTADRRAVWEAQIAAANPSTVAALEAVGL